MTFHTSVLKLSGVAALALSLSSPALADVDPQAVMDGVHRQLSAQGLEVSVDSATLENGDDVLLSGITFKPEGPESKAIEVEKVLLESVSEGPNGAFLIGRVAFPSMSNSKDGMTVEFEGGSMEGYVLPGADEADPIIKSGLFRRMEIGSIHLSRGSDIVATFDGITVDMSPYEPGGSIDFDSDIKDFHINFDNVPDENTRKGMAEVGYSELNGRGSLEGSWDTSTGQIAGTETFEVDDAATLNIDFDIGGYTPDVVAGLQQLQTSTKDKSDEAVGMAMMGLMQQLEVNGLSIEIVDDSATGKILDYVAKKQGSNRASIVAMAKGMLPFVLAQIDAPEFSAKVTAAVGAYLEDPQSLKIEAMPATPVPAAQIMAAAMTAPKMLIDTLGVKVTANE